MAGQDKVLEQTYQQALKGVVMEIRRVEWNRAIRAAAKVAQGQWVNVKINPSRAAHVASEILKLVKPEPKEG